MQLHDLLAAAKAGVGQLCGVLRRRNAGMLASSSTSNSVDGRAAAADKAVENFLSRITGHEDSKLAVRNALIGLPLITSAAEVNASQGAIEKELDKLVEGKYSAAGHPPSSVNNDPLPSNGVKQVGCLYPAMAG